MRKLVLLGLLAVAAIACGETAGEMLTDAGQRMIDAGDVLAPDAGAQTEECPCEAGPQGEPGEQGEPGLEGEQGPSGIVSATSFIPAGTVRISGNANQWACGFGTDANEQLDVAAGQRALISGQGQLESFLGADIALAWREVGDSTNGTVGNFVSNDQENQLGVSVHLTDLTPPLTAGAYEFGICTRHTGGNSAQLAEMSGTALVINSGT